MFLKILSFLSILSTLSGCSLIPEKYTTQPLSGWMLNGQSESRKVAVPDLSVSESGDILIPVEGYERQKKTLIDFSTFGGCNQIEPGCFSFTVYIDGEI